MAETRIRVVIDGQDNLSPAISRADSSVSGFGDSLESSTSNGVLGFGSLKTAALGAFSAFVAQGALQMISTTYEAGEAASRAGAKFSVYADEIGGAEVVLQSLRAATGDAVTDFELMQQGSTLLQLKIANSNEQLAEMLGLATKLGDVDAFVSVMKNGAASAEMLDNIGVSAARVKEILAASGKTASDQAAYSEAVVQAMRESVERMGGAVNANVTAVDRFGVRWDNFWTGFQTNVAQGIDGIAGLFEYAAGLNPIQVELQIQQMEAIEAPLKEYSSTLATLLTQNISSMWDGAPPFDVASIAKVFSSNLQSYSLMGIDVSPAVVLDQTLQELGMTLTVTQPQRELFLTWYEQLSNRDPVTGLNSVTSAIQEQRAALNMATLDGIVSQQAAVQAAKMWEEAHLIGANKLDWMLKSLGGISDREGNGLDANYWYMLHDMQKTPGLQNGMYSMASDFEQAMTQQMKQAAFAMGRSMDSGLSDAREALMAFYADLDAQGMSYSSGALAGMELQYEHLQELSKEGLLSDVDVKRAGMIYDRLAAVADMNLSGLLGVGGGGAMGEIFDQVLAGMPDGMQDELTRMFDITSGKANDLSIAFEDNVIPMLQQMALVDPELAAQAVANLTGLLQTAAGMGLTPTQTAGMVNNYMAGFVPTTGIGSTQSIYSGITVKEGDTVESLAKKFGVSVDQIRAALGLIKGEGAKPGFYGFGGGTFNVSPGDTAGGLAALYGLTPEQILMFAGAKDSKHLMPGNYKFGGAGFDYNQPVYGSMDWAAGLGGAPDDGAGSASIDQMFANIADSMADAEASGSSLVEKVMEAATTFDAWQPQPKAVTVTLTASGDPRLIALINGAGVGVTMPGSGTYGTTPQRGNNKSPVGIAPTKPGT